MSKKNILFNTFFYRSKKLSQNLKKTKKCFQNFKSSLENFELPLFDSYEKDYCYDFSKSLIRKFSKYKTIIIIGMGGSILGTKSIYSFLEKKIKKKIFFFDNLDDNLFLKFTEIKNLKNSCFLIVSKSGNTLETITNLNIISSKLLIKNKLIFITELKDNALVDLAEKFNAEIIEHKEFIGGRYSVFSEAGMFPSALMGLNIDKFKNLKKLINNKNFVLKLIQNVASIYTLNSLGIKNSVILSYDTNLNDLAYWYQQLIGESLGKGGKGITPIVSPTPKDNHSLLQLYLDGPKDKFFTFFSSFSNENKNKISKKNIPNNMKFLKNKNLKTIINAQCDATKNIFKKRNIPFRHFVLRKNSEEELGKIFTFFVLETVLLANLMQVNPFDQPAVEQIKIETKKILSG